MRRLRPCALACAAALTLAACAGSGTSSSSSTPSAAATTPATPASTSTATAPPATTSTPASTPAATTPAGPAICRAANLELTFLGGQAATGHGLLGFAMRNTGSTSCDTYGYPGVLFLDKEARPLPTIPTHTTHDFFGTVPLAPVTVAAGATVSFRLGVTHGFTSTAGCTTAYGLQVIPPNDTATLRTSIPNGAYQCRTVTVSPVVSGTSAYP